MIMKGDDNADDALDVQDVLEGLNTLAGALEAERYPGRAWSPPRRPRQWLMWAAAGAATAAAVLLAAGLSWWGSRPRGAASEQRTPIVKDSPASPPAAAKKSKIDWDVPSAVTPSLAGAVDFSIPSVSLTPSSSTSASDWNIPSLSFPLYPDERNPSDEKNPNDSGAGRGADDRSGGVEPDGAAQTARPSAARRSQAGAA